MIFYYGCLSEGVNPKLLSDFLDIELATYIVYDANLKTIVELFQSINAGKTVNTDSKVWGIMTDFNVELKELASGELRLNLFDNDDGMISIRKNYKIWFYILKICGHYQGLTTSPAITGNAISGFVSGDEKLSNFKSIVDIYTNFRRIFDKLTNVSGQYTIINTFFILHRASLNKKIELDDDNYIELVYICNSQIHGQASSTDRYKKVIEITNNYFYEQLERTFINN
jgi:hypothetical protein